MDSVRVSRCRLIMVLTMMAVVLVMNPGLVKARGTIPKLVDVDWLKQNLTRENIKVIDLRGQEAYLEGHIPGAVLLNPDVVGGMDAQALSIALGKMGIDSGTIAVACSDRSDWKATWMIWMLDYLGHPESAILDGGFMSWVRAKGAVSRTEPVTSSKVYALPAAVSEEIRISPAEVKQSVEQGHALLLETCTAGSKNSRSRSWNDDLTASGTWKGTEELRQAYKGIGATPEQTILVACAQSDTASTHIYFTLKHMLGYPRVKIVSDGPKAGQAAGISLDQNNAGTGQDPEALLKSRCTSCHGINKVLRHKADRAGWEKSIDKMLKRGAKLTPAERLVLIDHLARNAK